MQILQNSSLYPSYVPRLRHLAAGCTTFSACIDTLLADRYGTQHVLLPVLERQPSTFLANGDDALAQRLWASEQGMPAASSLDDILLAQIEHHRADVFYNLDPISFPGTFARRLPGSVKARIAWRAAPSGGTDFTGYDLMVCNFPGILESFRRAGLRSAYFAPAFDPEMAPYAANADRPIDVAFVGTFSRHHSRRTEVLRAVAALATRHSIALHLETSRFTRFAEWPLVRTFVPARYQRPPAVRHIVEPPVFGRDLYHLLSRTKIVVNSAIDMAGRDKGNIRCFETMGNGALLLSDAGRYPEGMQDGVTLCTYSDVSDLAAKVEELLQAPDRLRSIARAGHEMLAERYSKVRQWAAFQALVADVSASKHA